MLDGDDAKKPEVGRDRLELRVGVRAQKRWSRYDPASQDRIETGPEGFARYDRPWELAASRRLVRLLDPRVSSI